MRVVPSSKVLAISVIPTVLLVGACSSGGDRWTNSDFLMPLQDSSVRSLVALPENIPYDWHVSRVDDGLGDLVDGQVPGYSVTFAGPNPGAMVRLCFNTPGNETFCDGAQLIDKHASHEDCVSGKDVGQECSGYTKPVPLDLEHPLPGVKGMISYKTPTPEELEVFKTQPLVFDWEELPWVTRDYL